MLFEREADVLAWYESQERVLTPAFLETIPWHQVKDHELNPSFVATLLYMRDVEMFTGMYYDQLRGTTTVKDPVVKQFMDRWSAEEPVHGHLLNRFLAEAGYPSDEAWAEQAYNHIPRSYHRDSRLAGRILSLVGDHIPAVHMTWGAINEYSTLSGYQRMWQAAKHPVLEYILKAIAREEAMHSFFYWSVARIKLNASRFSQQLARFLVDRYWAPVGSGAKTANEVGQMIRTLFSGEEGFKIVEKQISRRLEELPGFAGDQVIMRRVSSILTGPNSLTFSSP